MLSILSLGFLMGMRHALDADHLAAVASLATRSRDVRSTAYQGAMWGLGHTVTLLVVGGICLMLGSLISTSVAEWLELVVGIMLLGLGAEVFWRMRRKRIHVHVHQHSDGTAHFHAHSHLPAQLHDDAHHEHRHAAPFPKRAFLVGAVHGLAGSAALLLVTLAAVPSPLVALAYIVLFGVGSVLGMGILSAVIAVPLRLSAQRLTRVYNGLEALIGVTTLVVGIQLLYSLEIVRRMLG